MGGTGTTCVLKPCGRAQLVGAEQAKRRMLRRHNPELPGSSASNTLVANIQVVMPGETARAHRHSPAALC
jgi:gentisate 1,2-dioxygenase